MTNFDLLTILISVLAIVISFISLYRTRQVQAEQLKFQQKQNDLAEEHLKLISEDASLKQKAMIIVTIVEKGHLDYRIVIRNGGSVTASDFHFKLEPLPGRHSPLEDGDLEDKLPIPKFAPDSEVSLYLAVESGTGEYL